MTDVKQRYQKDPVFHQAVEMMRSFIRGAHLAPSEITWLFLHRQEAAMLACIIEEERRPATALFLCCDGNDPACPTHGAAASNARRNEFYKP